MFSEESAEICTWSGLAANLLQLKDDGFKISEGDPLLLIECDVNDPSAVAYFESGNYGLPVGSPGHVPCPGCLPPVVGGPLAAGVAAGPPHALGQFITAQPGVQEKSRGGLNLFYIKDLTTLSSVITAVQSQAQFRRKGPVFAGAMGVAVEPPLLQFTLLTNMSGPPQHYVNFNQTA